MKDIDQIRRSNMAILEEEAGGSTAAAARLGWDQPQWSNLRSGAADSKTGKPRGMRKDTARKIEAAFGREPLWLDNEHSKASSSYEFGPDTIPILGHANGGDPDAIRILATGDEIGRAPRHPNQSGMRNAFAVYTSGESMSPRYRHGELVYVCGGMPPVLGQDCVVEIEGNEAYLKEFVRRTDKEIVCRQHNPAKEWRMEISRVKAIHAVVGRG